MTGRVSTVLGHPKKEERGSRFGPVFPAFSRATAKVHDRRRNDRKGGWGVRAWFPFPRICLFYCEQDTEIRLCVIIVSSPRLRIRLDGLSHALILRLHNDTRPFRDS